jgi:hypothetical protein
MAAASTAKKTRIPHGGGGGADNFNEDIMFEKKSFLTDAILKNMLMGPLKDPDPIIPEGINPYPFADEKPYIEIGKLSQFKNFEVLKTKIIKIAKKKLMKKVTLFYKYQKKGKLNCKIIEVSEKAFDDLKKDFPELLGPDLDICII